MLSNLRIEYRAGEFYLVEDRVSLKEKQPGIILHCVISGLCGTDVRMIRKERECSAVVIGHEAITYVVEHNSSKITTKPGDRVFINPNPPKDRMRKGHIGHDRDGLFQRYIWLSEEDYFDYVLDIIPKEISDNNALAIEPLSCGWHTLSKLDSTLLPIQKIAIFGAGTLSAIHLHLFKVFGARASNIYLFNRSVERGRDIIDRIGLANGHFYTTDNIPKHLESKFELVLLINSNANQYISQALNIVSNGGKVIIFGGIAQESKVYFDEGQVDLLEVRLEELALDVHFQGKELTLVGTRGFTNEDSISLINELAAKGHNFPPLLFQEYHPSEFVKLLNSLITDEKAVPIGKQVCKFA